MKRYIAFLLALCLILAGLTGCKDDTEEYNNEAIDEGIYAIYADLMANLLPDYVLDAPGDSEDASDTSAAAASGDAATSETPETPAVSAVSAAEERESILPAFRKYIHKWAADNDIKASHDDNYNIIMSKSAVEGKKDADSTILHCELSTENAADDLYTAAALMYIIKNADDNAFFRVIITANDENTSEGALAIDKKYLKGDHLISLSASDRNRLCIASGGIVEYEMTAPLTYTESTYDLAYEISISGIDNDEGTSKSPNPIKTLGNLLANYKSSGILFEMASFEGGSDAYTYPQSARVVLLINENNKNSFVKKFENSQSKFLSKYEDKYPELSYTLTEVETPQTVLSFEDSDYIVSLVYTLMNGTYLQDEDDKVIATSNLGMLTTNYTGGFKAGITAKSTSLDTLSEMSDSFEITCHLCNGTYNIVDSESPWSVSAESPANSALSSLYYSKTEKELKTYTTLEKKPCSIFAERKPELDMACLEYNIEKSYLMVEVLFEALKGQEYRINTPDTESAI